MGQEILLEQMMSELKDIRKDMVTKNDIKNMATKDDIKDTATKKDLNIVQKEIMNELDKTNKHLQSIDSKQHIIYEQTGKLSEFHTETLSILEQLATKEDLEYFDKKITEHDRNIFKIKNNI